MCYNIFQTETDGIKAWCLSCYSESISTPGSGKIAGNQTSPNALPTELKPHSI